MSTHLYAKAVAKDTTNSDKKAKTQFSIYLNSKGTFLYSGRVLSDNPTLGLSLMHHRGKWIYVLFKAADPLNHLSEYNFTMARVYRKIQLTKNLSISPTAGIFLIQENSIADRGSDLSTMLLTTYKLGKYFTAEMNALMFNLVLDPKYRDWVNRYRLGFSKGDIAIDGYFWHNNKVLNKDSYISTGLGVNYSGFKISKKVPLTISGRYLYGIKQSDSEVYPIKKGLTLSIKFTL